MTKQNDGGEHSGERSESTAARDDVGANLRRDADMGSPSSRELYREASAAKTDTATQHLTDLQIADSQSTVSGDAKLYSGHAHGPGAGDSRSGAYTPGSADGGNVHGYTLDSAAAAHGSGSGGGQDGTGPGPGGRLNAGDAPHVLGAGDGQYGTGPEPGYGDTRPQLHGSGFEGSGRTANDGAATPLTRSDLQRQQEQQLALDSGLSPQETSRIYQVQQLGTELRTTADTEADRKPDAAANKKSWDDPGQISGPTESEYRLCGFDGPEMIQADRYEHPAGSLYLDSSLKDRFTRDDLQRYTEQVPNLGFKFDIVLTDKFQKKEEVEKALGPGAHAGWHLDNQIAGYDRSTPEIRAEVGQIKTDASGIDPRLSAVLLHEWGHEFEARVRQGKRVFDAATILEPESTARKVEGSSAFAENFTTHLEEFMAPDKRRFDEFVEQSPLKAMVMAQMFQQALSQNRSNYDNPGTAMLRSRTDEALERTVPKFVNEGALGKLDEMTGYLDVPQNRQLLQRIEEGWAPSPDETQRWAQLRILQHLFELNQNSLRTY